VRLLIYAAKETSERHKTVSTERAQHTEIHLPRYKEPLRFGSTRAKFARGNMVSTFPMNIASRGSRAQSILGFRRDAIIRVRESGATFAGDKVQIRKSLVG
jgi:hypothetical protein